MSGKFQPFHVGHYFSYNRFKEMFDDYDEIYIVTSNKHDDESHIFDYDEKVKIITTLFPLIDSENIIKVKQPYNINEFVNKLNYDTDDIILIYGIGEKDFENRLKDFVSISDNNIKFKPASETIYKYKLPQLQLNLNDKIISATEFRNMFKHIKTVSGKIKFFKEFYNKFDNEIFELFLDKILD